MASKFINRLTLRDVSSIDPKWLMEIKELVTKGKILTKPPPYINSEGVLKAFYKPLYGPKKWELPMIEI